MRPWAARSDERSAGGSIISPRLHSHLDSSQILPRVEKRAFWNTNEDMLVSYFFSCLSFWASLTQVFTLSVFFCFLFFVFCFLFFVFFYEASTDLWERKSNYLNGSGIFLPFTINNGNRTKWSPIRTVIIRVIIKIVDLSITSTIIDRIGGIHSCYKLITVTISGKKIHLGQTSLVKTMSKVRNSSILEIPQFTFFFPGWVVVAMVILINFVIGGFSWVDLIGRFSCPITTV